MDTSLGREATYELGRYSEAACGVTVIGASTGVVTQCIVQPTSAWKVGGWLHPGGPIAASRCLSWLRIARKASTALNCGEGAAVLLAPDCARVVDGWQVNSTPGTVVWIRVSSGGGVAAASFRLVP